jgi:M61 glycyl aminopeptidase
LLLRTSCRSLGSVFSTSAAELLHLRKLIRDFGYIYRLILTIALFIFVGLAVQAQDLTLHLTVVATETREVKVEGSSLKGATRWSFKNVVGRLVGLGDRIHDFHLKDQGGQEVAVKAGPPGQFVSDMLATEFSYVVDLNPPQNSADAAHASWLDQRHGVLMLGDLLPELSVAVGVTFSLPPGWTMSSGNAVANDRSVQLPDPATGVFLIGPDLKEVRKRIGAAEVTFVSGGEWPFSQKAAIENAARIVNDYRKRVAFDPTGQVTVMLVPFPRSDASSWSADTRGMTTLLVASASDKKLFGLGQLSVVLCHEFFHLWVPNSLSLTGDYDWFFEGFTLYEALVTAVRLHLIDFDEYLATLSRVYDSYLLVAERNDLSLLEASTRRWTSGSSLVYDKGMLIAFLYDLKARTDSRNRDTLDSLYMKLFRHFSPGSLKADGNEAISSLISEAAGRDFAKGYIETGTKVELSGVLPQFGIQVLDSGAGKRLQIAITLTKEQRQVLRAIGYR